MADLTPEEQAMLDEWDAMQTDNALEYADREHNIRTQGTIDVMPPFSLREWLWQQALQREGQQFADRTVGRPQRAADRPISIGDFAGLGLIDMIDAPQTVAGRGYMTENDIADVGFGVLETLPLAGGAVKAGRKLMRAAESAADARPALKVSPVAKEQGDAILALLRGGKADEVTDRMFDLGNPKLNADLSQYLFENYDLPMDAASREARSAEFADAFHGTDAYDLRKMLGNTYTSDNPSLAGSYTDWSREGSNIMPLKRRDMHGTTNVEGGGALWANMNAGMVDDPAVASWLSNPDKVSTRELERAATMEGRSGVTFNEIRDIGRSGLQNANSMRKAGIPEEEVKAYLEQLQTPSTVDVRLSPNLLRSRFARFDPRLKHLSELTAAGVPVAIGGGLLAAPTQQEQMPLGILSM